MPQPLKVNLLHALSDFLDAYPYSPAEVVLVESISNAIDIDATQIDIRFDESDRTFNIKDNGAGMSKEEFENYHTVALSAKKKGTSIGFAGVGSKVYLAASREAEITTQTMGSAGSFGSLIRRIPTSFDYDELVYDYIIPSIDSQGTLYSVKMEPSDFSELRENCRDWVAKWFSIGIATGRRKMTVDGDIVMPWMPEIEDSALTHFDYKGVEFKLDIIISKDDLPAERRHLNTTVYGKLIKRIDFPWIYQLRKEARDKIYAILYADALSEHLSLSKLDFKAGPFVNGVINTAYAKAYEILEKKGLLLPPEQEPAVRILTTLLTNTFSRLLFSAKFKKYNPWVTVKRTDILMPDPDGSESGILTSGTQIAKGTEGGRIEGSGINVSGDDFGSQAISPGSGDERGESRKRQVKTIGIAPANLPNDPREGWVDVGQKAIVINTGHKMYQKLEKQNVITALNLNVLRVLTSAVLDYKRNELPDLTAEQILKVQSEMIVETWVNV